MIQERKYALHGPNEPTSTTNKAVRNDFKIIMIKEKVGFYQVITYNRK